MAGLPPLVLTGNRIDALGPLDLYGAMLHSFCLPADRTKVQSLLDRTFATPSHGAVRYEAVGDKVFLSFAEIDRIVPTDTLEQGHGSSSEIDVTLWIVARRADSLFAPRFIPAYLFVDNGPAMATGREVWGFPKQLGQFDFTPRPTPPSGARSYKVKGYALPVFAPASRASWVPLCEVTPTTAAPSRTLASTLDAFGAMVLDRMGADFATLAGSLPGALSTGAVTMAFLKQFPDAADPMKACYQGIIEAQSSVLTLRGAGLTDDHYRVLLSSYASLPFQDELGISTDWQDVGRGIWVDFDFALALGTEVWRATI